MYCCADVHFIVFYPRSRAPIQKLTPGQEILYPLRKPLLHHHVHNSQK